VLPTALTDLTVVATNRAEHAGAYGGVTENVCGLRP